MKIITVGTEVTPTKLSHDRYGFIGTVKETWNKSFSNGLAYYALVKFTTDADEELEVFDFDDIEVIK